MNGIGRPGLDWRPGYNLMPGNCPDALARAELGFLCFILRRLFLHRVRLLLGRDSIFSAKPSPEINVGAPRRAERVELLLGRPAADGAGSPRSEPYRWGR